MSEIEWGPEIKVDGKRPEWFGHREMHQWIGRGVKDWGSWDTGTNFIRDNPSDSWDIVTAIRLPAGHPYYETTKPELSGADDPAYSVLRSILDEAYQQAASGKGKERHANGKPWSDQPIAKIGRMVGIGFNLGQVMKKAQEASRMDDDAACRELLGAIVYAASAIMLIREREANRDA